MTSSSYEKTRKTKVSHSRSRLSIFSNNKLSNNLYNIRFDAFGNEIIKGEKNHKVSFIDNISHQKIAEVILIESFDNSKKKKSDDVICKCSCYIF